MSRGAEGDGAKVLVAYASRTGATAGVADTVARVIREGGIVVDVMPVEEVGNVDRYSAVVLGSAIRSNRWLPEALDFVRANRSVLAQRPFAAFLVCMTLAISKGKYRDRVAGFMQPVRDLVTPVGEGLFAGVLDISRLDSRRDRLLFRLSVTLGVWSEGDHRDWEAIRSWAVSIRPTLLEDRRACPSRPADHPAIPPG